MRLRYTFNNSIEGEHVATYSPKGWQETEIVFKRHEKYDGIFKDYTIKADFFCGAGKEYLDNIYDTQGFESEVSILIEIDCDDSDNFQTLYEGEVMMKTYEKIQAAPEYTRVNLTQAGISQTILNRLDVKVDLAATQTMDGTALTSFDFGLYEIELHSKIITEVGRYEFASEALPDPGSPPEFIPIPAGWTLEGYDNDEAVSILYDSGSEDRTLTHSFSQTIIPEVPIINEIEGYSGSASSLQRDNTYPATDAQFQSDSLAIVGNDGISEDVTIDGKLKFGVRVDFDWITGNAGEYQVSASLIPKLYIQVGSTITLLETKPEVSGINIIDALTSPVATISVIEFTELTFEFSHNATVNEGDVIRVYLKFDSVRVAERPELIGQSYDVDMLMYCLFNREYSDTESSYIKITKLSEAPASTGQGAAIFETGAKISQVISDSTDAFRSNFFGRKNSQPYAYDSNGCGSFMAFMDGFGVRGFPIADRPLRMSMNQYFEGLNPIWNLGLGVYKDGSNYYLVVEPKEFFYTNETILTFSYVTNLLSRFEEKYIYNQVKIGYSEWEKEGTNGLDEYNSKREYALKIKKAGNSLDRISDFIAGAYALELTRRKNYVDFLTEDTNFDNKIFPICLNRSVDGSGNPSMLNVPEKDENFSNIDNILSPETAYNLRIAPERNVRNFFNVIGTSVIKMNATLKDIKFTYGEGNYKMQSQGEICDPALNETINGDSDLEIEIPGSFDPIFTGDIDEFAIPFSFTQYQLLNTVDDNGVPNQYKKIEYSTSNTDYYSGYILELRYKPVIGIATIKTARAYPRTVDCTHIYVESGYVECEYVE